MTAAREEIQARMLALLDELPEEDSVAFAYTITAGVLRTARDQGELAVRLASLLEVDGLALFWIKAEVARTCGVSHETAPKRVHVAIDKAMQALQVVINTSGHQMKNQ